MSDEASSNELELKLTELTAQIVSTYLGNHSIAPENVPGLISSVRNTLANVNGEPEPEPEKLTPAVNPKRSVFEDYIVCLECGQKCKTLKRHLASRHDLSPEEYRAKWGLAADYPMTAPSYSKLRSNAAKESGLGQSRGS